MNSVGHMRDQLRINCLTPDWHERTCGYWYTVTQGPYAHTAFATKAGLERWMKERGLEPAEALPETRGEYATTPIVGAYREVMHASYGEFYSLQGEHTRTLSNGRYTLAIVTKDEDGIRTVHTLNPNCRERPEYDYFESKAMMDGVKA